MTGNPDNPVQSGAARRAHLHRRIAPQVSLAPLLPTLSSRLPQPDPSRDRDAAPSDSPRDSRRDRAPVRWAAEFGIFGSTFAAIFAAEFGDKTQLAVLLMAAESQAPWTVFAGAAIALVATSLVGVLLGRWLARRLSLEVLETAVGAILLAVSVSLLWDVVAG